MLDLLATIYLAWLLSEGLSPKLGRAIVFAVLAATIVRGVYVMRWEHRGSPVVQMNLPRDEWTDAMAWLSRTSPGTHVLADPGHAWKYGTSVRVAGERDVYLEEV
jgi:hypothetical protein